MISKFLDLLSKSLTYTDRSLHFSGVSSFLFVRCSTLIPTIAVPVSLIGTFMFMQFFGITLNLITFIRVGSVQLVSLSIMLLWLLKPSILK
jgi:HAE1 family hydrophobic/amphiphilic exporter-1